MIKLFNFGESMQRWVLTFYNNIKSCVMNIGFSTGYFDIKRGVRQGDPLSSILFVIVMEVLLIRIRNDQDIECIEINDTTCIKISCYADDLTCFPKNIRSARNIMQVLDKFHRCSSLKVNIKKLKVCGWVINGCQMTILFLL